MNDALKLRAEDAEDLGVISACLQDALVALSDMEFVQAEKRFVMVANRFRWENCMESAEAPRIGAALDGPSCVNYERVNAGVVFDGVERARRRGLDQRERGRILELLAMKIEDGAIVLEFAGGAAIRLEGIKILCHLTDIGEPWPTQWRPRHPTDDPL
jgi:hypothetical protein